MAIKSAMFRTCGISEDESIGGAAHDITTFVLRLRNCGANTEEQRRAQAIPVGDDDVEWLRKAYLQARYPKPWEKEIPAEKYNKADAERAIKIADAFLKWAAAIEDLPDPGVVKEGKDNLETQAEIRKQRWAGMAGQGMATTGGVKPPPGTGHAWTKGMKLEDSDMLNMVRSAQETGAHRAGITTEATESDGDKHAWKAEGEDTTEEPSWKPNPSTVAPPKFGEPAGPAPAIPTAKGGSGSTVAPPKRAPGHDDPGLVAARNQAAAKAKAMQEWEESGPKAAAPVSKASATAKANAKTVAPRKAGAPAAPDATAGAAAPAAAEADPKAKAGLAPAASKGATVAPPVGKAAPPAGQQWNAGQQQWGQPTGPPAKKPKIGGAPPATNGGAVAGARDRSRSRDKAPAAPKASTEDRLAELKARLKKGSLKEKAAKAAEKP
jgi:hypothetical protein